MVTTRVLVVDDAVVVRRLVARVLEEAGGCEVTTAANGRIALAKLTRARPDIVLLDVEMPELDGLGTLRELRAIDPSLPVVMFSTLTERGASVTLEAMALGASDYVTKPSNAGSVEASMAAVRDELLPKIRALCGRRDPAPGPAPAPPVVRRPRGGPRVPVQLVAVGASTGGPRALHELLEALPVDLPVPVLVVQHMPPVFTRLLAERLDAGCGLDVAEAQGGEQLGPGQVWIAQGSRHLVTRATEGGLALALDDGPPEHACRPAVDVLFRSLAATVGAGTLGVVLTGMGTDGARGAAALVAAGATVLAQDEATSVVWGMPGAVARAGLADAVVPLPDLAAEVLRRVGAPSAPRALTATRG